MKRYKHITIRALSEDTDGRLVYSVTENETGNILGEIMYHVRWGRYAFTADKYAYFDGTYLESIVDFMTGLK